MKPSFQMWVLLAVLLITSCKSTENGAQSMKDDSPTIFRVGTTTVTVQHYTQRMEQETSPIIRQLLSNGQTREQITELANQEKVRQSILDSMIQEELLLQLARKEGIGVDPEAIDAQMSQPTDAATDPATATDTTEQRAKAAREQLVMKMIARNTRAAMFKSRHILVEDEETADKILADLDKGSSFADLARELSTDPSSKEEGGELGWVTKGQFVPEYDETAFSAELNTPIKIKSEYGWHIIEIEDRSEDRAFDNFEQLNRTPNGKELYKNSFIPWYNKLREEAEKNGDLEVSPNFNPNDIPLPFPPDSEIQLVNTPESAPSEETEMPEDPEATDKPETTAKPTATDKPETTAKPTATDKPETTAKPTATDKPSATDKPEESPLPTPKS